MPIAVYVLGMGIFALVTSELQVTGMMPEMARDLDVPTSGIGYLISLYALAMAVGGPILTTMLLNLPRRSALIALFVAFVLGEVLGALAPEYWLLAVARLITGAVSGAFFGVAITVAIELAPPRAGARASSIVLSGLMGGTVLGLPLASWIGSSFGWRASFWAVAAMAVVMGPLTASLVPRTAATDPTTVRGELAVLKQRRLWAVYSTSTLVVGATYAAFSYFTPILSEITGFSRGSVTVLLFVYGMATIVGNDIVGRLADDRPIDTLKVGLIALAVLLLVFALFTEHKLVAVVAMTGVGLVGVSMNPALVARVVRTVDSTPMVNTVHTSCITMGVVLGASVGGLGVDTDLGLRAPLWIGAAIAVVGFLTLLPDMTGRRAVGAPKQDAHGPEATEEDPCGSVPCGAPPRQLPDGRGPGLL